MVFKAQAIGKPSNFRCKPLSVHAASPLRSALQGKQTPSIRLANRVTSLRTMLLDTVIRVLAVATTAIIIGAVCTSDVLGLHVFFSWHPIFMSIGTVLLLSLGVVSYVSDFGKQVRGWQGAPWCSAFAPACTPLPAVCADEQRFP